ncbi:PstS family phosphate ABC transporter substrate-binding protein [Flavobacterium psychrotolerans]|uniref:Phosphate ABC transporter substrate-binding protein n=1 Tax=Flavobacterium psychrotolerans TaxID=2169410 RepID=A0A2U1JN50_9FLAO|nr:substrate-binding domain-containing protein [Flavobacterium psychrotolerans]PWA06409.1 phosphate ABC transporter substrate-binding protein [Flavobacterium psychrotolerans]
MKKLTSTVTLFVFLSFLILSCNNSGNSKPKSETILEGSTTILVDETLKPIVEDQIQVFESLYKAKISIDAKSEAEVIQSLVKDSSRIAILPRKLTIEEMKIFEAKNIVPKTTPFAKDAIALIANKNNNDTLIALKDIIGVMQGKVQSNIKGLVFDNPNSSTARYINLLAGIKNFPQKGVFSFKTNNEVIQYVAKNDGMIGVVGVNFLSESSLEMKQYINKINVLEVKNDSDINYYAPTQNNIAEGKYPLARDLYIINCQGYSGLGMGFASFLAGEIGQRIVLKSGLVPVRTPSRKILIRKEINNDKK